MGQVDPDNPAYLISAAVRLSGPLDEKVLHSSIEAVSARHEPLRYRIDSVKGEPVLSIAELPQVPLRRIRTPVTVEPRDISVWLDEALQRECTVPMALNGRLFRAALLDAGRDSHVLLLTTHHIVSDAWSLGILITEIFRFYEAATCGEAPKLPVLAATYRDFVEWEVEWLRQSESVDQAQFWREQLANAPVLDLRAQRLQPGDLTTGAEQLAFDVCPDAARAFLKVARDNGATPFMALLAAWAAALEHYSGQDDICVGAAVSTRPSSEFEPLIGLFVNLVVMRVDLAGHLSFNDLVVLARRAALAALQHRTLPFDRVVRAVNPPRVSSRTPLFQTVLSMQPARAGEIRLADLVVSPMPLRRSVSQYELSLDFELAADNSLHATLTYRDSLFDRQRLEEIVCSLASFIDAAGADPSASLGRLFS
jgi:hypothetical protein